MENESAELRQQLERLERSVNDLARRLDALEETVGLIEGEIRQINEAEEVVTSP